MDEIIIGLIFDPIKNEIFYAEKNNGSFINNNRIRVSNKSNLDECLFASNNDGIKSIYPKLKFKKYWMCCFRFSLCWMWKI